LFKNIVTTDLLLQNGKIYIVLTVNSPYKHL
jgi:hypothetical protein